MTRAGFMLPGVDVDEYIVKYRSREFSFSLIFLHKLSLLSYCIEFLYVYYSMMNIELEINHQEDTSLDGGIQEGNNKSKRE